MRSFFTPLQYYHYLRREGYSHLNARACTLMRFCKTADDLHDRLRGKKTK